MIGKMRINMKMKPIFITIFIMLLACTNMVVDCKPGCLSDSYNLKEKYDPKEYHEVVCYCPCDYWAMRGLSSDRKSECLQCGHAHNPGPNPYVPKPKNVSSAQLPQEKPVSYAGLAKLITAYKANKQ